MNTLTDREEITSRETEVQEDRTENHDRGDRTLQAVVIALAVALLGLGAWMIIDRTSTPETAPTDNVAQLWDDYSDAWNNHDGDAFLQLVTSDYTFVIDQTATTAEAQATFIERLGMTDWHVTPIGEPVMAGDGPWVLSQVNRVDQGAWVDPVEGISVLTIVDDGGVLRVANHTFFDSL